MLLKLYKLYLEDIFHLVCLMTMPAPKIGGKES